MKIHKLILLGIIVIGILASCKKSEPVNPVPIKSDDTNQDQYKTIPQKMFQINSAQALKIINDFKSRSELKNNPRLKLVKDSIPLDSSVFVIEAVLNYDFDDYSGDNYYEMQSEVEMKTDPINIKGGKISSDDLEAEYSTITDFINSTIDGSIKARVVDIEPLSTTSGQIVFRVIIKRHIKYIRPFPCIGITIPGNVGCGSGVNGMLNIQNNLLGCQYHPCPSDDGYYINVTQTGFFGGPNNPANNITNVLFYLYNQNNQCPNNNMLSVADQNTYIANIDGYVQSHKPNPQSVVAAFQMMYSVGPSSNPPLLLNLAWSVSLSYATPILPYSGCQ